MPEPVSDVTPPTAALTLVTDAAQGLTIESRGQIRLAVERFAHHRLAVVGLIVFLLLLLLSTIGPVFWQYSYSTITAQFASGPSAAASVRHRPDRPRPVRAGHGGRSDIGQDGRPGGADRDDDRHRGRRDSRLLRQARGHPADAVHRPDPRGAAAGGLAGAGEQTEQAGRELALDRPHPGLAAVDEPGPAGARRVPVAAGTGVRRGRARASAPATGGSYSAT